MPTCLVTLKTLLYDLKTTNQSEKMTTSAGKVETIILLPVVQ